MTLKILMEKLELIEEKVKCNDEIRNTLHEIQTTLKSDKRNILTDIATPKDSDPNDERLTELEKCKDVKSILDHFSELSINNNDEIVCNICMGNDSTGVFKVENIYHDEVEEADSKQSRRFINLKKNIKRHFTTKTHVERVEALRSEENASKNVNSRNMEVGMRIARVAYVVYKERHSSHFKWS